jgi:hypothetical protein
MKSVFDIGFWNLLRTLVIEINVVSESPFRNDSAAILRCQVRTILLKQCEHILSSRTAWYFGLFIKSRCNDSEHLECLDAEEALENSTFQYGLHCSLVITSAYPPPPESGGYLLHLQSEDVTCRAGPYLQGTHSSTGSSFSFPSPLSSFYDHDDYQHYHHQRVFSFQCLLFKC